MMVISEYIFNQLKVCPIEILEVYLHTSKQDTKKILFKPIVHIDKYVVDFLDTFTALRNLSFMNCALTPLLLDTF